MSDVRLDGQTAIVTGAGGNPSLGRAHAMLLARLGANVVVNDIGPGAQTPGYRDAASAEAVAAEIRALGGAAVADNHSVETEEGARAIVSMAIEAFGGLEILVNNAAFSVTAAFDALTSEDFERHIRVNLMGPVWTCRAAWAHMRRQAYGRIINTTSGALAGGAGMSAYGASKGGLFSLTRSLASEGEIFNIKVNAVNPGAFTRLLMATQDESSPMYQWVKDNLPAEAVSPVVAYLASRDCPVTGECIEAYGGLVRRLYLATTAGFSEAELTIEAVATRWPEVVAGADPSDVPYIGREVLDGARPYRPGWS
jgi:NAD(P)-dependent dehydrogenase (short-subunit alcohol dehydrogenase family)